MLSKGEFHCKVPNNEGIKYIQQLSSADEIELSLGALFQGRHFRKITATIRIKSTVSFDTCLSKFIVQRISIQKTSYLETIQLIFRNFPKTELLGKKLAKFLIECSFISTPTAPDQRINANFLVQTKAIKINCFPQAPHNAMGELHKNLSSKKISIQF